MEETISINDVAMLAAEDYRRKYMNVDEDKFARGFLEGVKWYIEYEAKRIAKLSKESRTN